MTSTQAGLMLLVPVRGNRCVWTTQDLDAIRAYVGRFDGREVRVNFSPPKRSRSTAQNRFYWSVPVGMIAQHTGHTPEEVHEFLKAQFLPRQFITIGQREVSVPKSSTDLDTVSFEVYLEHIRAFAAQQLGLNIPLPNEVTI